jgi:hypothetical protein
MLTSHSYTTLRGITMMQGYSYTHINTQCAQHIALLQATTASVSVSALVQPLLLNAESYTAVDAAYY